MTNAAQRSRPCCRCLQCSRTALALLPPSCCTASPTRPSPSSDRSPTSPRRCAHSSAQHSTAHANSARFTARTARAGSELLRARDARLRARLAQRLPDRAGHGGRPRGDHGRARRQGTRTHARTLARTHAHSHAHAHPLARTAAADTRPSRSARTSSGTTGEGSPRWPCRGCGPTASSPRRCSRCRHPSRRRTCSRCEPQRGAAQDAPSHSALRAEAAAAPVAVRRAARQCDPRMTSPVPRAVPYLPLPPCPPPRVCARAGTCSSSSCR
jgi:hypothetical protein